MAIEDDILAAVQDVQAKLGTPVVTVSDDIAALQSDVDALTVSLGELSDSVDSALVPLFGMTVLHSFNQSVALSPNGQERITDLNAATPLTVPANTIAAMIVAETEAVRFTNDGTTPTSSVGVLLTAGSKIFVISPEVLANLQFINAQANDAALSVSYFK